LGEYVDKRISFYKLKFSLCVLSFFSINPVTGSYEAPRPNPLENMSEEQKEYEAVKLVNMIDQLQR